MSKKSINSQKFLELVSRLEGQKHAMPGMEAIVELFNEFGQLMQTFYQTQEEADRKLLWTEANACNDRLQTAFADLCKGWGLSVEEVQAMMEDSNNYSPEEWRQVQDLKREACSAVIEEPSRIRNRERLSTKRQPRKWA